MDSGKHKGSNKVECVGKKAMQGWGPGHNCLRGNGRIKREASTQAVRGLRERNLYPRVLRAGSGVQGKITGVRGPGQWRGLG